MLNRNLLRAAMAARGYTQEGLAKKIGISANTLSSRLLGTSSFNVDEIDKICEVLCITSNEQKIDIFLSSPSQKWESETDESKEAVTDTKAE